MDRNSSAVLTAAALAFSSTVLLLTGGFSGSIGKWLYDFQTLIAGSAAVVGAFWTIERMNASMRLTKVLADDQRQRDFLAARSVLALALSQMCGYARDCGRALRTLLEAPSPDPRVVSIPDYF